MFGRDLNTPLNTSLKSNFKLLDWAAKPSPLIALKYLWVGVSIITNYDETYPGISFNQRSTSSATIAQTCEIPDKVLIISFKKNIFDIFFHNAL